MWTRSRSPGCSLCSNSIRRHSSRYGVQRRVSVLWKKYETLSDLAHTHQNTARNKMLTIGWPKSSLLLLFVPPLFVLMVWKAWGNLESYIQASCMLVLWETAYLDRDPLMPPSQVALQLSRLVCWWYNISSWMKIQLCRNSRYLEGWVNSDPYHATQTIRPKRRSRFFSPSRIILCPIVFLISLPRATCRPEDFEDRAMIESHKNGRWRRSSCEVKDAGMTIKGKYCSIWDRNLSSDSFASLKDGSHSEYWEVWQELLIAVIEQKQSSLSLGQGTGGQIPTLPLA